jgi:acyl-CoA thioesterase-1
MAVRWILLTVLVAVCAPTVGAGRTIVVLGDSLSAAYGINTDQGWVHLLAGQLQSAGYDVEVINASVSGETTSGGLTRLPGLLEAHEPAVLILELGANDGLRGLPLDVIEDNLQAIIEEARRAGARVLLIGMRIPPNYGPRYSEGFFQLFQRVAEELDVALLPFLLEGVAEREEWLQADRLHPTAAPQALLARRVRAALEPLLPTPDRQTPQPDAQGQGR